MSETKSVKDYVYDFVVMLGGTGVVIGGIWGFYQALRLLFTALP